MEKKILTCDKCSNVIKDGEDYKSLSVTTSKHSELVMSGILYHTDGIVWKPTQYKHYCQTCFVDIAKLL